MDYKGGNIRTSYFLKSARTFYFIAIISFTVCLALNQQDYFKNSWWDLILIDSIGIILIYSSLLLYLRKIIGLRLTSAIYVYTTLINLSISTWLYFDKNIFFTGNFLFSTFMYCINTVVAGLCIGRKHAFIAAGLYVVSLGPLIIKSHDIFLNQNVISIIFLIIAFSAGVSGFLHVLEKTHKEEMALKEEIFKKDKIIAEEHNNLLKFELESKQREIVTKTMFLLESAENNNDFIKKLNTLKDKIRSSEQKLLCDIIQEHKIDHHVKYWKEFERSFLDTHPDFYKKLQQICPNLSPSELKLAALIHLGLSTKQIGNLSSNTPESIDVARSRLRTKLNMPPDANLKTFLLSI